MQKIFCFGEILLRMSPNVDWTDSNVVKTFVGGAEINVALALAKWQQPVKIGTALPANHFVADELIHFLDKKNIDTASILREGKRIGTYYLQQGADLKSAGVEYDRAYSSFSELKSGDINWAEILKDVHHIHFTAITPALSQNVADVCLEMLQVASTKQISISLDLNYRSKLWQYGKKPIEILPALAKYSHIIMGNVWAAKMMLDINLDEQLIKEDSKNSYLKMADNVAAQIFEKFPNCQIVANTFRFNQEDNSIKYFATINKKGIAQASSKDFICADIVDKAGSGDCFMAGILYGFYNGKTMQQTVDFAVTAATGKFYELGDFTQQTLQSIAEKLHKNE